MSENREYFHLDEATDIKGLSRFDIIEMVRSNKIKPYAWIPQNKLFAVTKFKKYPNASILGSFLYEGIVSIDHRAAIELLDNNQEITLTYVTIEEPQKIQQWSSEAPKIKFPNNRFYNHVPYTETPKFHFISCTTPVSASENTAPLYKQITNLANAFNHNNTDALEKGKKLMEETLDRLSTQIESASIKIKPNQFRFKKSEICSSSIPFNSEKLTTPTQSPNPLDEIILSILKNGHKRSDQIWNVLRQEAKKEIFDRSYDPYGILLEVSNERLIWSGVTKERDINRRTFINKVSKLRKEMKNE